MERFLYDLHVHTSESSKCGASTAVEMADFYKAQGYTGIVITDHFYKGNTCIDRDREWEDWVNAYCMSYEHAKARGDEIGLDVFFGWELSQNGDYVTLGLDKSWLLAHPEVRTMGLLDYFNLVHADGGFLIHAHPFLMASYVDGFHLYPLYEDAVEVINGGKPESANKLALAYARSFDKIEVGGSDAHSVGAKRLSGVVLPRRISSVAELVEVLKERKHSVILKNV